MGGYQMKIAFSWDDGAIEDKKLFELHEKYEIPGMFFVPNRNREGRDVLTPLMIRSSESKYVKFGGHTMNHTYLTNIKIKDVEKEVVDNKHYLEDILGHGIPDFCLPGGRYNDEILSVIYEHYRTIRTADTMNFTYVGGPLKPAIHFYPRGFKSLLGNAKRSKSYVEMGYLLTHAPKTYFELVNGLLELENKRKNRVVMIWGHSWELEKFALWDELERLFVSVKDRYNVCDYEEMFKV